jgi:hypothetical protein
MWVFCQSWTCDFRLPLRYKWDLRSRYNLRCVTSQKSVFLLLVLYRRELCCRHFGGGWFLHLHGTGDPIWPSTKTSLLLFRSRIGQCDVFIADSVCGTVQQCPCPLHLAFSKTSSLHEEVLLHSDLITAVLVQVYKKYFVQKSINIYWNTLDIIKKKES